MKHKISNIIRNSNTSLDISRVNARFLNILDLNIVPLNIHALMREIPLTNIYNYAFTYDHIVKQLFDKPYNYSVGDSPPTDCDDLLLKLFLNPYYTNCPLANNMDYINSLLGISNTTNNTMNNKLGRSKYMSDILSHAILADNPRSGDEIYAYTNKSDNTLNTTETYYTTRTPYTINMQYANRLHNKYFRNLIFLTNLQRLIHYKVKTEVEIINSKVVSDMAITNSQIVNYDDVNHPNLEETDFEYFMTDD